MIEQNIEPSPLATAASSTALHCTLMTLPPCWMWICARSPSYLYSHVNSRPSNLFRTYSAA